MINDKDFAKEVTRIINLIAKTIEDNDITGNIDVDVNGDILNITTQSGISVSYTHLTLPTKRIV